MSQAKQRYLSLHGEEMSRMLCRTLTSILILVVFVSCAEPSSPPSSRFARPVPSVIKRLARVADGVYRGSCPDEDEVHELKRLGIKTVIDFRTSEDDDYTEALNRIGIERIRIPISAGDTPTDEQISRFLAVVTDPLKRPVLFHCRYGRDRTGAFCAIYRMECEGWSSREAVEEMRFFGFRAFFYSELLEFVSNYTPHIIKKK